MCPAIVTVQHTDSQFIQTFFFFLANIIGDPLILGTIGNRAVLGIEQGQKLNDWWEEDNKEISK